MGIKLFYNLKKTKPKKKIFILGTGRSGTHLLARSLGSCSEVDANIENSHFFKLLTYAAIYRNEKSNEEKEKLIKEYDKFLNKSKSKIVLDKTHPNLWLVDCIDEKIPNSFFIGIRRNVYATVNSMLNHKGVLKWYEEIDLTKVNAFLGITEENALKFKDLPIESKCALRWKSHNEELLRLKNQRKNFMLLDYEEFYDNLDLLEKKINNYIEEQLCFKVEQLNKEGDVKWKKSLTSDQIKNIDKVLY